MRCFYCGTEMTTAPSARGARRASFDHLTPTSRGGFDVRTNKVRACQACNRDKGQLTVEEYRVVKAYRQGSLPAGNNGVEFWGERQAREREEKSNDTSVVS